MAPEPGLFSVRRPRETLGGISNNASALPLPSSALKRSNSISNFHQQYGAAAGNALASMPAPGHTRSMSSTSESRMSILPSRPSQPVFQRASYGANAAEAGMSMHRNTMTMNIFGASAAAPAGRRSFAPTGASTPASALKQSDAPDFQRRSSVFSARPSAGLGPAGTGAHQSFFATAPLPAAAPADPRRLRDASVRQQMAQELMDYLAHANFEMDMKHSLSQKSMTSPTQKDFNCMFQWLYHRIDPSYRFQKGIESEVPALLKQLRYPFEKSIMKSQIAAVGGNNWHTFLGLLHWLMQLAKMLEQFAVGSYDYASLEAGYDVDADKIIFDFLSSAYHDWLSVEDNDGDDGGNNDDDNGDRAIRPHVEVMAARFEASTAQHMEQIQMLEAEQRALQEQVDQLEKSGPKLARLEEQIKSLEEDKGKFEAYNGRMEEKVAKGAHKVAVIEQEIARVEGERDAAEREKASLQETVDRQGLTVQDMDRMNAERDRLQKGGEATSARLDELRRKTTDKALEASNRLDELERLVDEYNSRAYQIGLIPSTAANALGHAYELKLTVNPGPDFSTSQIGVSVARAGAPESDRLLADAGNGYQPHHLLNLDLRGTVKSNILSLRKDVSERRNAALEADVSNHDLLDKIKEAIDDKQAEVDGLGHRVRAAEEEFEKTREITAAQKMGSDAQIEKMEKELAKMRAGLSESVQLMEQREINTNIEYEQLTHQAAALREELHTEVERMLNDIIRFKVHVQKSLEDYEQFVADEVERECADLESATVGAEVASHQHNLDHSAADLLDFN